MPIVPPIAQQNAHVHMSDSRVASEQMTFDLDHSESHQEPNQRKQQAELNHGSSFGTSIMIDLVL